MNKKALEMSFNWIFAIIVGAVILFLAIYFVGKIISTGRYQQDSLVAKELSSLTNPLGTGFAETSKAVIDLKLDTRIFNDCSSVGNFGKSILSATTRSGIGKEWGDKGVEQELQSKYIFSEKVEEGKKLYVFTREFNMPFYVSDIMVFTSKNYCFINIPYDFENEFVNINAGNLKVGNCTLSDIQVCFNQDCDISIDTYEQSVTKNGSKVYYTGELIYAAIFSDKETYECNIKRLMKRISHLTLIYQDKIDIINEMCFSGLGPELQGLDSMAKSLNSSIDLGQVESSAFALDYKNDYAGCQLY